MEGRGGEREASRLRSKYMHRLIEKATQRDRRESRNRGLRRWKRKGRERLQNSG